MLKTTILSLLLAINVDSGGLAQTKSAPPSVNIRTAGDMAASCNATASPANAARINFCYGFAQGVLQTAQDKVCLPKPAPKRSETLKEFLPWVTQKGKKDELASTAFLQYMSERFPCKA